VDHGRDAAGYGRWRLAEGATQEWTGGFVVAPRRVAFPGGRLASRHFLRDAYVDPARIECAAGLAAPLVAVGSSALPIIFSHGLRAQQQQLLLARLSGAVVSTLLTRQQRQARSTAAAFLPVTK